MPSVPLMRSTTLKNVVPSNGPPMSCVSWGLTHWYAEGMNGNLMHTVKRPILLCS